MKLLLDTHIFIWWTSEPSKFLPQAIIKRSFYLMTLV